MATTSTGRRGMDMTHGPMLGNILLFALPLAASSILQLLFTAADQIVVGRFAGSAALAAVGSNTALINLLVNFFVGFSIGTNVTASRYFGAQDSTGVSRTVHTAMLLSVLSGLLLAVVGVSSAHTLLVWMSTPDEVLSLATLYLRIYFLGMPAAMVYNFGAALLRSVGDTRRPLFCLTAAGVVNVVLNLVLVIFFHMGVAGVALATIISQVISAGMVLMLLVREEGPLHLDLTALRIWPKPLKVILSIGVPAGLQSTIFSIANITVQATINTFGAAAVAGSAASGSIEGFVYTTMDSFAQTCVTFASQNLGAGNLKRVDKAVVLCNVCAVTVGLVMGISVAANGRFFLAFYSVDEAVIEAGMQRLMAVCATYALCGLMDCCSNAMRGIGYSVTPAVVSLCGSCLLRLAWLAFIFPLAPSIWMVYMAFPVSWAVTSLAHIGCYLFERPRLAKRFSAQPVHGD